MILAICDGENLIANPGGGIEIGPGQLLIALGSKGQLSKLKELLGEALINVEKLNS